MNQARIIRKRQVHRKGNYILYWMQQSQRVFFNDALNFACELANQNEIPLFVFFHVNPNYPNANLRHYSFMFEGLQEIENELHKRGIFFICRIGDLYEEIDPFIKNAKTLVMDTGYLSHQRKARDYFFFNYKDIGIYQIESDVVVPVEIASNKLEYSARTIRPKITSNMSSFLDMKSYIPIKIRSAQCTNPIDFSLFYDQLLVDKTINKSMYYEGGYTNAKHNLKAFIDNKLLHYNESNDPSNSYTSRLSMYLHFGQISVVEIVQSVLKIKQQTNDELLIQNIDSFIEQIVVRRELAINYVYYNLNYMSFDSITYDWAYETMRKHEHDKREIIYTLKDYIRFETHDPYFNAAMKEMVITGYMHNYMRMYWAKKIIEWSPSYQEAFQTIVFLNDTYFIDGRDPISYTSIAWCFGRHDRAWKERAIFGKLRYMNASGLVRKFNIEKYVQLMNTLDGENK